MKPNYMSEHQLNNSTLFESIGKPLLRGSDDKKKSFNIYVRENCSKQNICIMRF